MDMCIIYKCNDITKKVLIHGPDMLIQWCFIIKFFNEFCAMDNSECK